MRNPWKKGEWNGRYNDKSDDWTPALKKQLELVEADDGIFWIPYEDMCVAFSVVDICKIDDKNFFTYQKVDNDLGYAIIKFKYPKDSKEPHLTTFAVSQKDYRSEEADGNTGFTLNDYTRKVDVKFI